MRFFRALISPRGQIGLVFVIFGLLALVAYWPVYPGDPSQLPNCGCGDVAQSVWYMEWGPYAIFHGLSPLHTTILNYPVGSNLAISAEMLGISLPLSPITYFLSPVATYNLAMWLAFPLSATACFYVLRRWTGRSIPSFVGGMLFGFSAYTFDEGASHLNLSFIAFVPLVYLAIFELFVRQRNLIRWGLLLALFSVWQYFVSSEVFLDTVVMALIGLVALGISRPRLAWAHTRRALPPLVMSIALFFLVAGYPIWYSLFGPQHLIYPIQGSSNPFNADLTGVYTPNVMERFYPAAWKSVGSSLVGGDFPENGSFLGIPLILAWLYVSVRGRKNQWIRASCFMSFVAFILSLGPVLTIRNHLTSIKLPFELVKHRPIFDNVLPSRFSMDVTFFVITAVALGFVYLFPTSGVAEADERSVLHLRRRGSKVTLIPGFLILALVVVSLIPNWPYPSLSTKAAVPFDFPSINMIKQRSVVLTYPYPVVIDNQAMVWQATSGMKFDLLGGYNLFTFPGGTGSAYPANLKPLIVQVEMEWLANPQFYFPPSHVQLRSSLLTVHALRRFVRLNHVQAIVVSLSAPNAKHVEALFVQLLHRRPHVESGQATWILNTSTN